MSVNADKNLGDAVVDRKTGQGFTPGPWGDWRREDGSLFIGTLDHVYVCQMVGAERDPEVEANARLIAAAPMLYAAAMSALVYLQSREVGPHGKAVIGELIPALSAAAE